MANRKSEMYDAIENLAKAKDIPVEQIRSAVEDGCKAAYRKYAKYSTAQNESASTNLSVVMSREHDIQIFARKVVVPVSIASAMALTVPALFARWMEQGFFRLCGTTMLSILCLGAGGFLVALTKDERQWILSFVKGRR